MNRYLIGALAGFSATAAMTLAMGAMYRRLPAYERYPLLPREISTKVTERLGMDERLDEQQQVDLTLISHFSYGAAAGALYPIFARGMQGSPAVLSGTLYGLLVWLMSYLGWLPALGILRPATEHPVNRNGIMLVAHAVWGSATGAVSDGLKRAARSFLAGGPMRDAM
jgi:hypothetical protein